MAMYFDFERTAPTDNCFNPEQKNVCYVFCFNYCFSSAPEPKKNYCAKKLWAFIREINNDRLFN